MKKEYTIAGITGIVAIILISSLITFYNRDYLQILEDNPDQKVFLLDFDEKSKIEVLTRTSFLGCPYGLFRISKDQIKVKCGWRVAGVYSSWTEYWRTWGKNALGEEEWWQRNNRKKRLTSLDYQFEDDKILVYRDTPFYKGRSGSDGILREEFMVYEDGIKITASYNPHNDAKHRIIYRTDSETDKSDFDFADPFGNYKYKFSKRGKDHYVYGEKKDFFKIDPSIVLTQPADKGATANTTGSVVRFLGNCSSNAPTHATNVTVFVMYNSTLGWINITAPINISNQSGSADTGNQSYAFDLGWTSASYANIWPYGWYTRCCTNESIRDFCVNSSIRLLAINVAPSSTLTPTINSSIRSDQAFTCELDGSGIVSRSRVGRFSYDNTTKTTNGVVNLTWRVENITGGANHTWVHNTPNLTLSFERDTRTFNLSNGFEIMCSALLTDGTQNSTSWYNTSAVNITNGQPWGLNITYPDLDLNILNGTEDTRRFNVNWSEPSEVEGDALYYSGWLQETAGENTYGLFNYTLLNLTNGNTSSYDGIVNRTFNSSSYAQGNYYVNVTACEINFSGEPGSTRCNSDITSNTVDIFDYSIAFGPGVDKFRVNMPGGGTVDGLKPIGQTDQVGIFEATFTALGELNFTIEVNESLDACMDMKCGPYSNRSWYYDNETFTHFQGYNITNYSQGRVNTTLFKVEELDNYVWCWTDITSECSKGVVQDWVFNFDVHPAAQS